MRHSLQYRADDFFVEVFQRLNLFFHVTHVAGFVRGFDVNKDQVVFFKRADTVLAFAEIIGIEKAGNPWHVDALQSGVDAETVNDIDGGNHAAFNAEELGQRWELRRSPLPPQPNCGCLAMSIDSASFINGM